MEEPNTELTHEQSCQEEFTQRLVGLVAKMHRALGGDYPPSFGLVEGSLAGRHCMVVGLPAAPQSNAPMRFRPLFALFHDSGYESIELPSHARWEDGEVICGQPPDDALRARLSDGATVIEDVSDLLRGPAPRIGKRPKEIN